MKFSDRIKFFFAKSMLRSQRKKFKKLPVSGERFIVPREGLDGVDVVIYRPNPQAQTPLPVFFNLHGGAWVAGDAALLDSLCRLLADEIPCVVVNVNYKKVDVHPFPYQLDELCDAVTYFGEHADEMGIDKTRFVIGGESAGAHISAGVAIRLKEEGFPLAGQFLVYPFLDFTMSTLEESQKDSQELGWLGMLKDIFFAGVDGSNRYLSPLIAKDEELKGIAPAFIIVCGKDILRSQGITYAKRLDILGVGVKLKEYPTAEHGFLEVNRPETRKDPRKTPEQLALTRECEQYMISELRAFFYN